MKQFLKGGFFLCFFGLISSSYATDCGIHGHTFEIQEPDLLKQLEAKLHRFAQEGKLAQHQDALIEKTQKAIRFPQPVVGITKATKSKTVYFDPSIRVPYDLKDHKGQLFWKAGTNLNPLHVRSLPSPLLFIDGTDEAQVSWAQTTSQRKPHPKLILVAGSPLALTTKTQPVYFDQGGRLTSKLGIAHVPAVVVQEEFKLKITEIALEEEKK